ncbi:hypothetical protein LCGC14_1977810 [marine sediment metagenome]|uniref:Uncharacterized protein n=1 Tax=marine sediment metagenome TaxID=412755 RepID=A0A0F9I6T6_9ZZZZ
MMGIPKGEIVLPDTYNYNLACGNCSHSMCLKIPLGITIVKYAEGHVCPSCGCKFNGDANQSYAHPKGTPMIYLPYSLRRGEW